MAMTKMPISNTLKVMDLCNNGKDLEAMRMCGLNPASDSIPEGETFIDRVITVANTTLDMAPSSNEVLVKNSAKEGGVDGAVNDVVSGVQEMANKSIDESISRIIDNINYFDKVITKTITESEDKKVPNFKYNFIRIEKYIRDNYPEVYSYILDKYKIDNNFHAVGVVLIYKAYDDCKANGKVTVDDVKFAEDHIPSNFRKNKNFIFKLNESSVIDEMDTSTLYYLSSIDKCIKDNRYSISESFEKIFEDEEAENQGALDYINKDNPETRIDNEENKKSDKFDGDMKELVSAIQEYISTIPEKVKDLTNKVSAVISGKDAYIGLIVSTFVSCGAIYLIYKTNKSKEEGNSSVSECVNILKETNYFIKRVYTFIDEDASNIESFASESDYIKGAINAAMELDSKGYTSEFFEKCITNAAVLYDNYLSDASKLK